MGIEWIIVPMLVVACVRALISAAVDAYVAIVHPDREAPSLVRRRARVEIAQQQHQITGVTGVGQAVADRLASRIANPPVGPSRWSRAIDYCAALLADFFSNARRWYADKQDGKTAAAHCWICDTGHDGSRSGLCPRCELLQPKPCVGCGLHMLPADLQDGKCAACRPAPPGPGAPPEPAAPPVPPPTPAPPPQPEPDDAAARLVLPTWAQEPTPTTGRTS